MPHLGDLDVSIRSPQGESDTAHIRVKARPSENQLRATMVLIRDPTLESQCRCSPDDQALAQIEQVGKNAGAKQRVQDTRSGQCEIRDSVNEWHANKEAG